jgi:hypothetical protein
MLFDYLEAIMEIGDIVYIVPSSPSMKPYEANVWFSGGFHFSAGNLTFVRTNDGDACIGRHAHATVYSTQGEYYDRRKKRDAWTELRYIVTMSELPPLRLTAEEIESIIKLLKGTKDADISS